MEPRRVKMEKIQIDSGKYGYIMRESSDVQFKIAHATVVVANEDGERNRLFRIDLAIKMVQMSDAEIKMVEAMIEEELDLQDLAIEL